MSFDFIFTLLRKMFFNIDRIIYGLIDDVYGLVIQLAGTSIFSTEMINAFAERIYAFIGIFMLFKVTISLITHVLNPDDFTDKEKGFTSIIKRIILSLCMVVLVPYVFAEAYHFQKLILTENTLVTLIFGTPPDTNGELAQLAGTTYVDTAGKKMQFTLLSAFIHPNYEEFTLTTKTTNGDGEPIDLSACRDLYVKDSDGNFVFRNKVGSDTKKSRYYYALNPACFGEYDPMDDLYKKEYKTDNGTKDAGLYLAFGDQTNVYQTYAQGVAQQNYDLMFRQAIVELSVNDKYVMDYKYLISTVVGVVTLYMLVVFCIDIAVRSVKLGFLQMIAPIPIISYVDPKSGKDGMFKKWTNMCVKTYLDLFIRLFALFFGIYIISLIGTFKDVMDGETISDGIVNVFLIIGVLIFVKKLPEILKETLGFEGGTFKDFKTNPIHGLAAGALGGAVGALTGAGLSRLATGSISGLMGGKSFAETWKNTRDKNAKYRAGNRLDRNPFRRTLGRLEAGAEDVLGGGGRIGYYERQEANLNREIDGYKSTKESLEAEIQPTKTQISRRKEVTDKIKAMQDRATAKVKQGKGDAGAHYQNLLRQAEGVKASTATTGSFSLTDASGNVRNYSWSNERERGALVAQLQQEAERYANVEGRNYYMDNTTDDATLNNHRAEYNKLATSYNFGVRTGAQALDDQSGDLATASSTDTMNIADQQRRIQEADDKIKEANDKLRDISDAKKRHESYKL